MYGLPCKEKSEKPEDGAWKGRNMSWQKLCKNILVTKTLNKLCLTIFCDSIQHNRDVSPES